MKDLFVEGLQTMFFLLEDAFSTRVGDGGDGLDADVWCVNDKIMLMKKKCF